MNSLVNSLVAWRQFSVPKLGASILQALGVLWFIVEPGAFFFPDFATAVQPLWWLFLSSGAVVGVVRARPRTSVKERIEGTDIDIEIQVCDLFSLDGALIVGSNTTFDTSIEDGTISRKSVQGQYTEKYCPSVELLDRELSNSLQGVASSSTRENKPYGKRDEFELGTVASVHCGGRGAYFVAIATLNEHRRAVGTRQNILDALPHIWEHIRNRGDMEPLCCPVLGAGFSRLDTTLEALVREIVKSFVAVARFGRFCEKLTIAIAPKDFRDGKTNFKELKHFLECECKYSKASEADSSPPVANETVEM